MNERMKVIVKLKSKDGTRTFWRNVGVAWPRDDGSMSLDLFAMPVPQDGSYRMLVVKDDYEQKQNDIKVVTKPFDDNIPF